MCRGMCVNAPDNEESVKGDGPHAMFWLVLGCVYMETIIRAHFLVISY